MKIQICELICGDLGTLIDCSFRTNIFCPFCSNRTTFNYGIKTVNPIELKELIDSVKYIIKLI